ncbi:MAG: NUDIX domain-containing protein [Chloroflexi bacterium]|nr:NUDIX domain-containing protein [Chloroflexota bacterium]
MADRESRKMDWPPKTIVCVGAVVLKGDRALWIRQAPGQSLSGQWSIPWGFLDPGEAPEIAALRETREEANVVAEVKGLLGIQNLSEDGGIGIVFLCRHIDGEPTPDGVETDRAAYLSLAEMDALDEPFEPWCGWLVRRVLGGQCRLIPPTSEHPYHPRLAFL